VLGYEDWTGAVADINEDGFYADHAGCQETRKSTSGSMQLLGDRLVSWSSKKQKSTSISSTEAEYIAFSGCLPQKEKTFQVVIDLITNSSCFKAFTISAHVPEFFMQLFWYSIKKVQGTDSYEFILANKKCVVNADVFRMILDIYPRVKGVNFTDVPDDDTTLAFLIKHGYKGPLYKHTNMFMDHMHQLYRTLAAIINKCLSRKTPSNDKPRKSRIDILWGMFYGENVDYPELI
ncbi:retrovirus-related pol polyprotein from transposon TNT 1-94, partial [Tanacetum coccineum]